MLESLKRIGSHNSVVAAATSGRLSRSGRQRIAAWIGWIVIATAAFGQPLVRLMQYAAGSELNSYIPLVPAVTVFLLYLRRTVLDHAYGSSIVGTVALVAISGAALTASALWGARMSVNDGLALMALGYVSLVAAGGFLFLGSRWMASAAFPMAFLAFLVPMPDAIANELEIASMLASADVAAWFLTATGTPLLRDGQVLPLPGIVLEVAQVCRGIRFSWVLFITSLVASHLFLESPWRRIVLVAFVIPLGIVRNGFRILVIGLLCVYIGPHMIDSVIHHQGGPLFFVLSLGPLFLLLWWLRRRDSRV